MKTLGILLFCFLAVAAHAAPIQVLGFKPGLINTYNPNGSRKSSVDAKAIGDPKNLVLKQILDNGLCILQLGNEEIIVDRYDLKLPSGTNLNKEELKAYAGQGRDSKSFGVNGIGGD